MVSLVAKTDDTESFFDVTRSERHFPRGFHYKQEKNLKLPSAKLLIGEVIGQRFLGNESHVEHFKLLERASTSILIGA
ncbi:semaphorin-1A-like isoform X1, partial [Vespula squamosa]